MRYIKSYESLNKEVPKVGDYIQIIMNGDDDYDSDYDDSDRLLSQFVNFIISNVGVIINTFGRKSNEVRIKYDSVPYNLTKNYFDQYPENSYSKVVSLDHVDDYFIGETPEEVKLKIDSKNYNL